MKMRLEGVTGHEMPKEATTKSAKTMIRQKQKKIDYGL